MQFRSAGREGPSKTAEKTAHTAPAPPGLTGLTPAPDALRRAVGERSLISAAPRGGSPRSAPEETGVFKRGEGQQSLPVEWAEGKGQSNAGAT